MKFSVARVSLTSIAGLFALSTMLGALGCSADGGPGGSGNGSGGLAAGSGSTNAGTGGSGAGIQLGTGGDSMGTGGDRMTECNIDPVTGMEVCVCIKIATWGGLGTYGANPGGDGSDAISSWLNANSTGEADYFATKPVITREALDPYDVIILQDLNGWTFTPEEKAAFEGWVRERGGGVIALQGYSADGNEALPTNELVAFSGLAYAGVTGAGDTSGTAEPGCGYCLGNSDKQEGFVPTHPISANVTAVGAFYGRSVAGDGDVVAEEAGKVLGMTKQVDAGRVFLFHDEWVTYNSQWNGTGLAEDCRTYDANHQCYNVSPVTDFQIPQFWYNSLLWASGNPACFTIDDPVIIK